mgnify:CR=1 FL=1
MYDTNAVNAVTRAMRSEVSDHVTASEKKSLRELRGVLHFHLFFFDFFPGLLGMFEGMKLIQNWNSILQM